ncbi:MAG: hypothetical protein U0930_16065 [Pirellulales bacterium]
MLSDLHLEFSDFLMPMVDADVRILAGDVHTKDRGLQFAVRNCGDMPTLYIAGNHEFYGAAIPKLYDKLKSQTIGSTVSVLENDQVMIGDVRFLGCTLWTDFGLLGADTRATAMIEARNTMTDCKKIPDAIPRIS